jgi:uncharacterized RDD family membrane protein YckC
MSTDWPATEIPSDGHRAGLVSRMISGVIDLVTIVVLSVVAIVLIAVSRSLFLGSPFALPDIAAWLTGAGGSVVVVGYLGGFWYTTGRTPGMQVLALRVVDRLGKPLRLGQALLRAILCLAFPVGLLWVLVSRRNLSVQDIIARTAVVYDSSYGPVRSDIRGL